MKFCLIIALSFALVATSMSKAVKSMDSNDVAKLMASNLVKDGNSKENRDFIFGLIHHAIRGVAGVAHHAIHAVRGLGHAILGDEEQKDYYYGYGYHHGYHHPYYYHHGYYGDVSNDQA